MVFLVIPLVESGIFTLKSRYISPSYGWIIES